jgi:apolipoprotein N-acyltransferase
MPSAAVVLATALLWFFSTGAHQAWLLAWFAPAPVLALAYRSPARRAALVAFLAAALGGLTWLQLFHGLLPTAGIAQMIAGQAVVFTLVVLGARRITMRQSTAVAVFAFPVLLAGVEYLISVVSPDGTFGSLAYTQANFVTILQIASVTGFAGITFLVSLVPSGIAVAWARRQEFRAFVTALAVPAVVVAGAAAFGTFRMPLTPDGPGIRVGLAATDATIGRFDATTAADALPVVRAYARRVAQLATDGATVVVLPEKFVGVTPAYRMQAQDILAQAAGAAHVWVIAGFNEIGITPKENVALVFSPDGRLAIQYFKQHLLPAFESGYQAGHTVAVWNEDGHTAGVAICKDLDFASLGRAYAAHGIGIMFVPAWDFGRDGWLHSRMAMLRGIEGGFSVVRSAQDGRLTVTDPYGRVIADERSDASPDVLLAAHVQAVHLSTVYDRIGDWFAWACLIVAAGMLAGSLQPPAAANERTGRDGRGVEPPHEA